MGDTMVLQGSTAVQSRSTWLISAPGRSIGIAGRPSAARYAAHQELTGPAAKTASTSTPRSASTTRAHANGQLTLTRRGRLLLVGLPVALGIALLIVLGAFLTSEAQAGEGPAQSSPTISVTVGAGETLWGLASHHVPDRDPRDVVAEMVELNNLRSSVVQAGQSISIPAQG